jgi:hypothetical protein
VLTLSTYPAKAHQNWCFAETQLHCTSRVPGSTMSAQAVVLRCMYLVKDVPRVHAPGLVEPHAPLVLEQDLVTCDVTRE